MPTAWIESNQENLLATWNALKAGEDVRELVIVPPKGHLCAASNCSERHGSCSQRRLSTYHAATAPPSAVAELAVVSPNTMRSTKLWRDIAVSLIAAGPAGGFLLGLLNAGDPDPNPIGRLFYACMMTVVTPLHAGFPPHHAAGAGQSFNAWPHIAVSFLLILSWLVHRDWKSSTNRNEPTV